MVDRGRASACYKRQRKAAEVRGAKQQQIHRHLTADIGARDRRHKPS